MDLRKINHYGQEISKITKIISDANAGNELLHGNVKPTKKKLKNKVKNKLRNLLS